MDLKYKMGVCIYLSIYPSVNINLKVHSVFLLLKKVENDRYEFVPAAVLHGTQNKTNMNG